MGIHHSPHTHPTPIPMGIPMGIPIPTAALPIILVFPYQTGRQYFDGTKPPNGSAECNGGMKIITISDQYRALYRK